MIPFFSLLFFPLLFLSCKTQELPAGKPVETGNTYKNPVVNYSLPDPTIIKAGDENYIFMPRRI